jgi:hypothetical protein
MFDDIPDYYGAEHIMAYSRDTEKAHFCGWLVNEATADED